MGVTLHVFGSLLLLAVLVAASFLVFARVRLGYRPNGSPTQPACYMLIQGVGRYDFNPVDPEGG